MNVLLNVQLFVFNFIKTSFSLLFVEGGGGGGEKNCHTYVGLPEVLQGRYTRGDQSQGPVAGTGPL